MLLQTLGVSSLVLLSIGYLAGRYREGFEIRSGIVPALLAGAFTMVAAAGFAAIELMLGVDAPVSILVVREILVQGLLGGLLGFARLSRSSAGSSRPALVDYRPASRLLGAGRLRRRAARRSRSVEHSAPRRRSRRAPVHGGAS